MYASAYALATLEISSSSPKKNLYIRVVVYSTDKLLTLLAKVQSPFWKTSEFFANLAHIWLPWVPEGFFLLFGAKIERRIRDRDDTNLTSMSTDFELGR